MKPDPSHGDTEVALIKHGLGGHGEKTHRRRQNFTDSLDPAFVQDGAKESSIEKSLTGSEEGSEERDLDHERNHIHNGIGNESDRSNRQMGQLDRSPRIELQNVS